MSVNVRNLYEAKGFVLRSKGQSSKRGAEYAGPCPACGGNDRFCVWPEQNEGQGSYACRRCELAGDAIQFLIDFDNYSFQEAHKIVKGESSSYSPKKKVVYAKPQEKKNTIETKAITSSAPELWVEKASKFQEWCKNELSKNPEAIQFLEKRGISLSKALKYGIGYNPGENGKNSLIRHRTSWGLDVIASGEGKKEKKYLWLPRGIVIPCFGEGKVHRLRIRRDDADREDFQPSMKYYAVPGSEMYPLFLESSYACSPANFCMLVVESELDAYMLHAHLGDFCSVLAIMTAKISSLPPEIVAKIESTSLLLVATDNDENRAGYEGYEKWRNTFRHAKRLLPLGAKDPGDMFAAGEDLLLWVLGALPSTYAKSIFVKRQKQENDFINKPTQKPEKVPKKGKAVIPKEKPKTPQVFYCYYGIENGELYSVRGRNFSERFFNPRKSSQGKIDFLSMFRSYGLEILADKQEGSFILIGYEDWSFQDDYNLLLFLRYNRESIKAELREKGLL